LAKKQALIFLQISFTIIFTFTLVFPATAVHAANDKVWYVLDTIEPTVDYVKWTERGGIASPASWIQDGSWNYVSLRESLVGQSDIFVSTYERFNWSLVRSNAEYYYGTTFSSFSDFASAVQNSTGQWLNMSWQYDTEWYGIFQNTTKVKTTFDPTSSQAELSAWFHITRIPEYIVGEGALENWLTGFDMTPISTGNLEFWELYEDWGIGGTVYTLRFEAPASILTQHGSNYTFNIGVSSNYQQQSFKIQQGIEINMPPNTQIMEAYPQSLSVTGDSNNASFAISSDDLYPMTFTVISGQPAKSLGQAFLEGISVWFLTPAGWAAIASLLVLSFTGLRGRRIWRRNRLYRRLYKSMVTLYDLYAKDAQRFHLEMENVAKSIFKAMVEDKINDEQFEKLLKRRDDLSERADKLQSPPPPTRA